MVVDTHSGDSSVWEIYYLSGNGEVIGRELTPPGFYGDGWEWEGISSEIGIYDGTIISGPMACFFGEMEFILESGQMNEIGYGAIWPRAAAASSSLAADGGNRYDPGMAIDSGFDYDSTAWVEGVPGYGIGEYLDLSVDSGTELHYLYHSRIHEVSGYFR